MQTEQTPDYVDGEYNSGQNCAMRLCGGNKDRAGHDLLAASLISDPAMD